MFIELFRFTITFLNFIKFKLELKKNKSYDSKHFSVDIANKYENTVNSYKGYVFGLENIINNSLEIKDNKGQLLYKILNDVVTITYLKLIEHYDMKYFVQLVNNLDETIKNNASLSNN